jgi:hypothetical protein
MDRDSLAAALACKRLSKTDLAPDEPCFLYVFTRADHRAIKVGVARDALARMAFVGHPIDPAASFVSHGSREACFRAESVMHAILAAHQLPSFGTSGGTEWFDAACRGRALEILAFLAPDFGLGRLEPLTQAVPTASRAIERDGVVIGYLRAWESGRIVLDITVADPAERERHLEALKRKFGME